MQEKQSQPATDTQSPQPTATTSARQTKKRSTVAKKATKWGVLVAVVLFVGTAAGFGGAALEDMIDETGGIYRAATYDGNRDMTPDEQDITAAVNKVSKSVVSIVTEVSAPTYFGTQVGEGAGTGIIVSENGYILTNKHVIDGADNINVVTSDGTRHDDVSVVGRDPLNDVAFLKIKGVSGLPVAEIGESSSVRVAQEVIAIGNSLGQYQNTVTSGIISGKGRPVTAESEDGYESLTGLLQTDAAINPGNSGGPLINTAGQVVGINTAVAAEAQGIGFAIPIDATKGMLKSVLKTGKGERSYLGVQYVTVTPDVAKEYNLPVDEGAYVFAPNNQRAVVAGSPAAKAGIKEKDIIISVNDKKVGESDVMSNLVAEYAPGETITFEVLRDGKKRSIDVVLAAYPN